MNCLNSRTIKVLKWSSLPFLLLWLLGIVYLYSRSGGEKLRARNSRPLTSRDWKLFARSRSKIYCNPIFQPQSDVTGSEGGQRGLRYVAVVTRHGDRSPMYGLSRSSSVTLDCSLNPEHVRLSELAADYVSHVRTLHSPADLIARFGLFPNSKTCAGSSLTGIGALQHVHLGRHLARAYRDYINVTGIRVESSEYSRTLQSAVAFLFGLAPEIRNPQINLSQSTTFCGIHCLCPAVFSLQKTVNLRNSRRNRRNLLNEYVRRRIAYILGINNPVKLPWTAAIQDALMGSVCHQVAMPCGPSGCVTLSLVGKIWSILDENGRLQLETQDFRLLQNLLSWPLLMRLADRMDQVATGSISPESESMSLYSGHDVTVTALCTALGVHSGKWPPYASRLVFEVFTAPNGTLTDNYGWASKLRVLFNGDNVSWRVRGCIGYVNKEGFCSLNHFIYFIRQRQFHEFGFDGFDAACATDRQSKSD